MVSTDTCSFAGCDRRRKTRDLCASHVSQRNKGKPLTPIKPYAKRGEIVSDVCLVDHCARDASKRGLCDTHYAASKRGLPFARLDVSSDEWFYSRAAEDANGCWVWQKARNPHGYGQIQKRGVNILVHRWSYEFMRGEIPDGLVIDHLCRNRACVNPDHMEPVPQLVNWARGQSPTAQNARKTECCKGHPFTPENTIRRTSGARRCRECMNDYNARYQQRVR